MLPKQALELEPFNVKALFRRSQAYMNTSDLDKAEEDIKNVLAIDPNNKYVSCLHTHIHMFSGPNLYFSNETFFYIIMHEFLEKIELV